MKGIIMTNSFTNLGLTNVSASGSASDSAGGCCGGGGCMCGASDSAAVSSSATADTSATGPTAATQDFLVAGMTCGHCVSSVTEELSELDGVNAVEVELNVGGASRVQVSASAPLDVEKVRAAVSEAGYELVGASA